MSKWNIIIQKFSIDSAMAAALESYSALMGWNNVMSRRREVLLKKSPSLSSIFLLKGLPSVVVYPSKYFALPAPSVPPYTFENETQLKEVLEQAAVTSLFDVQWLYFVIFIFKDFLFENSALLLYEDNQKSQRTPGFLSHTQHFVLQSQQYCTNYPSQLNIVLSSVYWY